MKIIRTIQHVEIILDFEELARSVGMSVKRAKKELLKLEKAGVFKIRKTAIGTILTFLDPTTGKPLYNVYHNEQPVGMAIRRD